MPLSPSSDYVAFNSTSMMPQPLSPKSPRQTQSALRSPSPSYFGLIVDSNTATVHTGGGPNIPKNAWSPSSTKIRSAASSPQNIRIGSNTDFEAFRRQSEQHRINIGRDPATPKPNSPSTKSKHASRPSASRRSSKQTERSSPQPMRTSPDTFNTFLDGKRDSPKSPKRVLSMDSGNLVGGRSRQSPTFSLNSRSLHKPGGSITLNDEKLLHSSPPRSLASTSFASQDQGIETSRTKVNPGEPSMVSIQHVADLIESAPDDTLVLDLRVNAQYARSRLKGSLNLCIPTTLLKRPSYNVARLADTFKDEKQRKIFLSWKFRNTIIVYDGSSSQLKEAGMCINIIRKFVSEGWNGDSLIVSGGFDGFSKNHPELVEKTKTRILESDSANSSDTSEIPPVIGGCPMPATKNAANPFFGNIRQNMDLIGGVGQFPIHLPSSMSRTMFERLPKWLKDASDEHDNGKLIADKFLAIEKREQERMREALSGNVSYTSPRKEYPRQKIRIAGIEKGNKNRYNNIWPYEHSRVKLNDVSPSGCDYINANFLSSSLSDKTYIATQGPIPATFNDFWNMVWQRDVRVIVMLTAESEGGQLKAHNYWNSKHYGNMRLDFLSEHRASLEPSKIKRHSHQSQLLSRPDPYRRRSSHFAGSTTSSNTNSSLNNPRRQVSTPTPAPATTSPRDQTQKQHVIVRNFTLSNEHEPFSRIREVTQLQYPNWPDFGTPASPANLLGLVAQCEKVVQTASSTHTVAAEHQRHADRPVLVHCSAGCGRSGTFCTVDTVLDALKHNRITPSQAQERDARQTSPMDIDNDSGPSRNTNPFFNAPQHQHENDEDPRHDNDLIAQVVEQFRLQRLSMVQSLRQFVLCYETVLEWLASGSSASNNVGEGCECDGDEDEDAGMELRRGMGVGLGLGIKDERDGLMTA